AREVGELGQQAIEVAAKARIPAIARVERAHQAVGSAERFLQFSSDGGQALQGRRTILIQAARKTLDLGHRLIERDQRGLEFRSVDRVVQTGGRVAEALAGTVEVDA